MKWTSEHIPALAGKTAVVTGANSGLGFETARALAQKGAQVILACRNMRKAEDAAGMIREEVPGASVQTLHLDLGSQVAVKEFAEAFGRAHAKLDLLVNNAGLMALPLRRTAEGFEMQFGTNHLGHFALTALLYPILKQSPAARVVTVSSSLYSYGKIDFEDLNWQRTYSRWRAYGRSKLANLLFMQEFDRRLKRAGVNILSAGAHPGYAATELQRKAPEASGSKLGLWYMNTGNRYLAQSSAMGALPQLYAATSPDALGGAFYGPDGWLRMRGYPKLQIPKASKVDPGVAKRLWEVSEELVGLRFGI